MSLSRPEIQPTYSPDQMKRVLEEALSSPNFANNSPLFHKHGASSDFEFDSTTTNARNHSSEVTPLMTDHPDASLRKSPKMYTTPMMNDLNHQPSFPPLSSPVRPLNTPSPARNLDFTPARTFEVEASFLQAMIGLLERQAKIVPDHQLTKSEVRRIVRKELANRAEEDAKDENPKSLTSMVTPTRIFATMVGTAGFAIYCRAAMKYPQEMAYYVSAALEGAIGGFAGAMVLRWVLWKVDKSRNVRNAKDLEQNR